jgi:hypothetical protein
MKITMREAILNSLVDDDESIVQIESELIKNGVSYNMDSLKKAIKELLLVSEIIIRYPPNKSIDDFINSDAVSIKNFWFGLTLKGYKEWDNIKGW